MDRGSGVGQRVKDFLDEAIETATRVAAGHASRFLLNQYKEVVDQVNKDFKQIYDALTNAKLVLVGERMGADHNVRKQQAVRIRELMSSLPPLPPPAA